MFGLLAVVRLEVSFISHFPREMAVVGWSRYFTEIERFVQEMIERREGANADYCHYAIERCGLVIRTLSQIEDTINSETAIHPDHPLETILATVTNLKTVMRSMSGEWDALLDTIEGSNSMHVYRVSTHQSGGRGRPRFTISRDQLIYLRSLNFSWSNIAGLLGVSRYTVYRRRDEYNLGEVNQAETLTDTQLEDQIREMRRDLPTFGEAMVLGALRSNGHQITRHRVRQAIHATDPINIAMRWRTQSVSRRPYSVPGPNCLWHIGEVQACIHTSYHTSYICNHGE